MDNQNDYMSIKQARLIVNAHKHNLLINSFATTGMYVYVKQHENNNKNQSKIKRERECSNALPVTIYLSLSCNGKTAGLGNEVLDSFKYQ